MPIYEYQCSGCKHELEAMQRFSDKALTLCPECNQESLHKKVSMSAFQLKGGGWYKDGYGKQAPADKSAKKETTTTDTKKTGNSSTSETKKTTTQKAS